MRPRMEFEEVKKHVSKKKKAYNRKTKTVVVFDEDARKEFLTGFHKRKNERKKKAKYEIEQKVKEERQAIKQKVRDMIRKSDAHRIPELEHLAVDSQVFDLPEHTVTVTDVSEIDLSNKYGKKLTNGSEKKETDQGKEADVDSEAFKLKQKKLKHKLAKVGNLKSKKVKRLGKGKYKGGGGGGGGKFSGGGGGGGGKKFSGGGKFKCGADQSKCKGQGKDKSKNRGPGGKKNQTQRSGNKKQKHK